MSVTVVHTFELKLVQRMKIKTLPLILFFVVVFFLFCVYPLITNCHTSH